MTVDSTVDSLILATIAIDSTAGQGRGWLYWSADYQGIACVLPDGTVEDTEHRCTRAGARREIKQTWGEHGASSAAARVWDLQWEPAPKQSR